VVDIIFKTKKAAGNKSSAFFVLLQVLKQLSITEKFDAPLKAGNAVFNAGCGDYLNNHFFKRENYLVFHISM